MDYTNQQPTLTGMEQHQPNNEQRQPSAKHQARREKSLMYHHNMTSFNKDKDYENKANTVLTNYFSMLSNLSETIKDCYFIGSMMTFSQYTAEGTNTIQLQGVEPICNHLATLNVLTNYTPQEVVIQPSTGQGFFIIVRGTVQASESICQFSMNLNVVKIRKNYYILNQYFNVS